MSVKSRISLLTIEQRRQLSHAFDQNFSQFVRIGETDEFVGVHIDQQRIRHLEVIEQAGDWCCGRIVK